MFPQKPCFLSFFHPPPLSSAQPQAAIDSLSLGDELPSTFQLLHFWTSLKPLLLADYVGCSTFPKSEGMLHDRETLK